MARTRGAKSSSPSTHLRIPETRLSKVPPLSRRVLASSHLRSRTHLPVLRPGDIIQGDHLPSLPTPSPPPAKKSPPPAKKPQPSQTPAKESQIPSGMTPERYHMEHLLTPRDFFYPRVALDFYQSMTTNQVRDPTVIHFTIDGRHGILGARHIAEALHIPFELARLEDFRA
ncbi:hypothetical protein CK203_101110 [Vitis vinifera]|uniref:Uncharacterized protein n=1 Tax=Vitis vinifera TaxID=29760 RepID=A0A438C609_VITVI|nr:hypothetical protein CK203_101110 [Vitis vinifera]